MKKAFVNTKVAVKLRKSETREEWYLYIESYPVFRTTCKNVWQSKHNNNGLKKNKRNIK